MANPSGTHIVNIKGAEQARNLLIFMDGTWNDENGRDNDGAVTNIYKLFSALSGTHEDKQVPHSKTTKKHLGLYFRGVGNDEDNIRSIGYYQGMFGAGEKNIRDHAYACICKYYQPGDRISIFGFSRGAASARLLAAKLNKYGLPAEISLKYKQKANKNTKQKEWQFSSYKSKKEKSLKVDVTFLGIFDTVGAFGIPINLGPLNFQKINLFRDLTLSPNVQKAVHLVAIDESRDPFVPTLTNYSDRVEEVWMPGVHADVGGGYHDGLLGNISLAYMVSKFKKATTALPVSFTNSLKKWTKYDLSADEFVIHYHGDGTMKDSRKLEVLKNEKESNSAVKIHESAFKLQEQENFFYSERLNSFATRVPIKYDPMNLKKLGANFSIFD